MTQFTLTCREEDLPWNPQSIAVIKEEVLDRELEAEHGITWAVSWVRDDGTPSHSPDGYTVVNRIVHDNRIPQCQASPIEWEDWEEYENSHPHQELPYSPEGPDYSEE
jgi:hypothetical protein